MLCAFYLVKQKTTAEIFANKIKFESRKKDFFLGFVAMANSLLFLLEQRINLFFVISALNKQKINLYEKL